MVGEAPTSIDTAQFQMEMRKESASTLADKALGANGEVTLPPEALAASRGAGEDVRPGLCGAHSYRQRSSPGHSFAAVGALKSSLWAMPGGKEPNIRAVWCGRWRQACAHEHDAEQGECSLAAAAG